MKICAQCRSTFETDAAVCPKDGGPLLTLGHGADELSSERYIMLGRLGVGGMSKVYRAYKLAVEKEVALKVLTGSDARDAELVERFKREATSTAKLRSPNTVRVYDFGRLDGGEPFIEMELLHGRSLEAIIDAEAPLESERVVSLALQICGSLEEAHGRSRVHRDIKPSNIMVERIGGKEHVTVLDFGLVKQVDDTLTSERLPTITDPSARAGTPQYMAPELWSEEFGAIGPGVDIYAFGVVLFQMLCKKRPFPPSSDISKIITNHLYQAPGQLSAHLNDAAAVARFSPIVSRCLAKRPEQRFASVVELRRALSPVTEECVEPEVRAIAGAKTQLTLRPPAVDRRRSIAVVAFALFAGLLAAGSMKLVSAAGNAGRPSLDAPVLRIESAPPGASIFLDGTPTGLVTPARLAGVPDHETQVSVHRAGCDPASKAVVLGRGEEQVSLDLRCAAGRGAVP